MSDEAVLTGFRRVMDRALQVLEAMAATIDAGPDVEELQVRPDGDRYVAGAVRNRGDRAA